jgi:hypothetical protein
LTNQRHGRLPDDAEGVSVELSGRLRSPVLRMKLPARASCDGRPLTGWANCRTLIVSRRSPKPSPAAPLAISPPMTVASIAAKIRSTYCSSCRPKACGFLPEPPVPLAETDPFRCRGQRRRGPATGEVTSVRYVIEQATSLSHPRR